MTGPPHHVVAAHGLRYSDHPYTHEDGTAKLASDRQPQLTQPKSWCVVHTIRYDIVRQGTYCLSVPSPWLFDVDPVYVYTKYEVPCRYVQIQLIPRANMFRVVLIIRIPSGSIICCCSTPISCTKGTYIWCIREIYLP